MTQIRSFKGWLLDRVVALDQCCPGLAGHVLRASVERRHVIAAYLSLDGPQRSFADARELGQFLTTAGHREILYAAFGASPCGLRAALSRGGEQPHRRSLYRYLFLLISSPCRPATKRLIYQLPTVNSARLRVARALPDDLKFPSLVMALRCVDAARDLATLVLMLEERGADRTTLVAALKQVRDMKGIQDFARRWSQRIALPPHPVNPIDGYQPLTHALELRVIGLGFRNCLQTYAVDALEGRSSFAIARFEKTEAIVHLVRRRGRWWLEDIYGPQNRHPDTALVTKWITFLRGRDINALPNHQDVPSPWACLRRLGGLRGGRFDWPD